MLKKKNLLTPCFSDGSNGLFVIPGLPHNQPCLCSVYVPSFRLRKKTKKMKTLEVYAKYLAQLWKKKNHTVHTQKKINNSNCHVTYTCWPRYTGDFPSAAGLVGLIVSVLNMSEHEFKFLVSVSHSTINVMDWRIFPSAYGHIYKKLIMEQPIIITPPVGTINQNECLSFCSKKKCFGDQFGLSSFAQVRSLPWHFSVFEDVEILPLSISH